MLLSGCWISLAVGVPVLGPAWLELVEPVFSEGATAPSEDEAPGFSDRRVEAVEPPVTSEFVWLVLEEVLSWEELAALSEDVAAGCSEEGADATSLPGDASPVLEGSAEVLLWEELVPD